MLTQMSLSKFAETASDDFNKMLKVAYMIHSTDNIQSVREDEETSRYMPELYKIGLLKKDEDGAISGINYGLFGLSEEKRDSVGVLDLYTKILERAYNVTYKHKI